MSVSGRLERAARIVDLFLERRWNELGEGTRKIGGSMLMSVLGLSQVGNGSRYDSGGPAINLADVSPRS